MEEVPRVPDEVLPPANRPRRPSIWRTRARFVALALPLGVLGVAALEVAMDRLVPNTWFGGALLMWTVAATLAIVQAPTLRESFIYLNAGRMIAAVLVLWIGALGIYALAKALPGPMVVTVTGRHLSPAQGAALASAMRAVGEADAVRGVQIFHVRSPEARDYAQALRVPAEDAGLFVRRALPQTDFDYVLQRWTPTGLTFFVRTDQQITLLHRALAAADIEADVMPFPDDSTVRDYDIAVWVGWNAYTFTPRPNETAESDTVNPW